MLGFSDGRVELYDDGTEVRRIEARRPRRLLDPSADRRWIGRASSASGGTVILDGATGEIARTFAPADRSGVAAVLDPTGELVIRPAAAT